MHKNWNAAPERLLPFFACKNKDLDRSLGSLGKFIDYRRIVALLPVIPYTQKNSSMNFPKGQKYPSRSLFAQPNIGILTHCCGDDDGGDGVFADLFGLVRMIAKAWLPVLLAFILDLHCNCCFSIRARILKVLARLTWVLLMMPLFSRFENKEAPLSRLVSNKPTNSDWHYNVVWW